MIKFFRKIRQKLIAENRFYRTLEGCLQVKKVSNKYSRVRYLEQIRATEKAINRLETLLID